MNDTQAVEPPSLPATSAARNGGVRALRRYLLGLGLFLLAASPSLLEHKSSAATVFGRYSTGYLTLLSAIVAGGLGLTSLALLPGRTLRRLHEPLARGLGCLLVRPWMGLPAAGAAWALPFLLATSIAHTPLGRAAGLHAVAVSAVLWMTVGAVLVASVSRRMQARALAKYAIGLVLAALVLAEGFLRLSPGLLPNSVFVNLPGGGAHLQGYLEAASRGEQLYRVNDTHWSRTGHELAASIVADYLQRH